MQLKPEQIICLARLSGEWLDLPEDVCAAWFEQQLRDQPGLAPALQAMTAEFFTGKTTATDPLSLPALHGVSIANEGDNNAHDLIGLYRLMSLLGRGGMGMVWLPSPVKSRWKAPPNQLGIRTST